MDKSRFRLQCIRCLFEIEVTRPSSNGLPVELSETDMPHHKHKGGSYYPGGVNEDCPCTKAVILEEKRIPNTEA